MFTTLSHAKNKLCTDFQRSAAWVVRHELWLLGTVTPFLLFPSRWTWVALLAIVLTWLCRCCTMGRPTIATPVDAPILLLVCMAGIGFYSAPDPSSSLAALWRIVLGVAIFYGLVNGLQSNARLRRLPAGLILGSLLLTLLALVGTGWDAVRLFRLPQVYERLPRLLRDLQDQNPFHPRVMGMALATLLPMPAALFLFSSHMHDQLWAGISTLAMGLTILLTQSVQAVFGVACALLFLGICWKRWLLSSIPLVLGMLVIGLRFYGLPRITNILLSPANPLGIAVTLRLDIWSRALAMLYDRPYTGIGLDAYPLMQWYFYPGVMLGTEPHAHNLLLQVALDLGLPGLLAFLWVLLGVGWMVIRTVRLNANGEERALLLGAAAGIVSCMTAGLLDTLWASKAAVMLWIVLGMGAGLSLSMSEKRTNGYPLQGAADRHSSIAQHVCHLAPLFFFLLLVPGLILPNRAQALNERLIRAQRVLLALSQGESVSQQELVAVRDNLRWLAESGMERASLYSFLGQAEAWLGQEGAALAALTQRVELDGRALMATYAPFETLRRWLVGEEPRDPWADAAWIYGHWVSRFPQRAEPYILLALVRERQGNHEAAGRVLELGLQKGAQPRELLDYAAKHAFIEERH